MKWHWGKRRDDGEEERMQEAEAKAEDLAQRGETLAHALAQRLERNSFGAAVAQVFSERKQ